VPETIDDDLRQRLFDHMTETGLSLNRMARRAGVTQSSLYRFMFSFSRKRPSKQAKLARYLGLELSESTGQKQSPK
jgi:transcriptional regulator with XRE-family HTH domain